MCLVYKCWNGLIPQYLAETLIDVSDKHEHHTKTKTRQSLNLVNLKINQLKLLLRGVVNWNDLNHVIRNATSLNIFKSANLKSHFGY